MSNDILPSDIDPDSRNRLPLPDPETLDETSRATYDSLADPEGGSLAGLRGPGGLRLHSPALSNGLRPVNMHLRQPDVIDARTRELAILVTAREHDCQFEWHAHEAEAVRQGVPPEIVDIVRYRQPTDERQQDRQPLPSLPAPRFAGSHQGRPMCAKLQQLKSGLRCSSHR